YCRKLVSTRRCSGSSIFVGLPLRGRASPASVSAMTSVFFFGALMLLRDSGKRGPGVKTLNGVRSGKDRMGQMGHRIPFFVAYATKIGLTMILGAAAPFFARSGKSLVGPVHEPGDIRAVHPISERRKLALSFQFVHGIARKKFLHNF